MLRARLKASFLRLLISMILVAMVSAITHRYWYADDLMWAGGIQGVKLIALVDVVLGPVLTFILFNPGKKGLLSDMIIIGCLQCLCFAFGTWALYDQRPAAFVLSDDGVHLLSNHTVQKHTLKLPGSQAKPQLLFLDLPSDTSTWGAIKFSTELADGVPLFYRDDLYVPLESTSADDYEKRINLIQSSMKLTENVALPEAPKDDCAWIPIFSKHLDGVVCFNQTRGAIDVIESKITVEESP